MCINLRLKNDKKTVWYNLRLIGEGKANNSSKYETWNQFQIQAKLLKTLNNEKNEQSKLFASILLD